MKVELIGNNDYSNPIKTVLENRNITEDLFELDESCVEDYSFYDNIQEAVDVALEYINSNKKIGVIVDSDTDGITSFSMVIRYFREVLNFDNFELYFHTGKQHGLSEDIIIGDIDLLIIPDAGSNDIEQIQELKDKGIEVIILDHHEFEKKTPCGILVNNQTSDLIENKSFSGAGVVYKFLQCMDDTIGESKVDNYLDLLMLGNIADVMDLRSEETRYLCQLGLENIKNPFIKALINKCSFDLEGKLNIMSIGWVIAPLINATIRSGTQEEKETMYKAFLSDDIIECEEATKVCSRCKSRQYNAVKPIMKKISDTIEIDERDRVLCVIMDGKTNSNHNGLVANKLISQYGIPAMVLKEVGNDYIGSMRGVETITEDFKKDLLDSGLVNWCRGHANAGGVCFPIENKDKLISYLNYLYKDKQVITESSHVVDFSLSFDDVTIDMINELAEYEDEWGNGLDEPLIFMKDVMIDIDLVDIKKTSIVFMSNGIKFEKKFATKILKDLFREMTIDFVNIVGRCRVDKYNNCTKIDIVDIEI